MSGTLAIRNFQKKARVNTRELRRITLAALAEMVARATEGRSSKVEVRRSDYDLAIQVVDATEMTRLNETFLRHAGSTDVITFDYSDHAPRTTHPVLLHGEIFICIDEARIQARRFRTTWQAELVRYVIHGMLHLLGYDDRRAAARREMKREENRLLNWLQRSFDFTAIARD